MLYLIGFVFAIGWGIASALVFHLTTSDWPFWVVLLGGVGIITFLKIYFEQIGKY